MGGALVFSGMHLELCWGPFLFEVMAKVLKVPGGVLPLGAASPRVGSTPDGVLAPGLGPDTLAPVA